MTNCPKCRTSIEPRRVLIGMIGSIQINVCECEAMQLHLRHRDGGSGQPRRGPSRRPADRPKEQRGDDRSVTSGLAPIAATDDAARSAGPFRTLGEARMNCRAERKSMSFLDDVRDKPPTTHCDRCGDQKPCERFD